MSLAAAAQIAGADRLDGEAEEDVRVVALRAWLQRARSRAAVILDEYADALAEVNKVAAALELAARDARGDKLQ